MKGVDTAMNTLRRPITGISRPARSGGSCARTMAGPATIRRALGIPPIIVAALVLPLSLLSFWAGALCLAFALGWTVLVGPCGCAHVGALNPVGCVPSKRVLWLETILAYTLGGVVSGAIVGLVLGWIGSPWLSLAQWWPLLLAIAMVCLLRETGLVPLPLLERRRQTRFHWFPYRPLPLNSVMWGLDVGLTFATWITFSGAWLLAALVVVTGSPLFGAALFAVYWLGRAAPHWIEPALMRDPAITPRFMEQVAKLYGMMRWIHAFGLAVFVAALLIQYAQWL